MFGDLQETGSLLSLSASKRFFLKQGDAHIPLYPMLKSLGVADDELEKDWGKIFAANKPKTEERISSPFRTSSRRLPMTITLSHGILASTASTFTISSTRRFYVQTQPRLH